MSRRCAVMNCEKWAFQYGFCREHAQRFAPMFGDALRDARMEAPVTPDALLGQGDPGDWACPRCTLVNSALGVECAMCLFRRPFTRTPRPAARALDLGVPDALSLSLPPHSPSLFRQITQGWACRVCTFVNHKGETRCSNCEFPRGDENSAVRELERSLSQARGGKTPQSILVAPPIDAAPAAVFIPHTQNISSPPSISEEKSSFSPATAQGSDNPTMKMHISDSDSKINTNVETSTSKPASQNVEIVDGDDYLSLLRAAHDHKEDEKSISDKRVVELWHQFVEASDVRPIISAFCRLRRASGAQQLTGLELFDHMRNRVCAVCPYRTQQWWAQLAEKKNLPCYNNEGVGRRVLIVGGSVAGLRSAIELAMLGAEVVCIELRDQFRRWNVLHIWEFCVNDLLQLGVKLFFPSFGTSEHQHIPIRVLQCHLLKVALCLGVTFLCPCAFAGIEWISNPPSSRPVSTRSDCMMLLDVSETLEHDDEDDETDDDEDKNAPRKKFRVRLRVDALLGCDGTNSAVANACGFVRKTSKGALAIGLTANFVNQGTLEENQLPQLQHAYQFNRSYFNSLKEASGLQCENLVYFRCPTNHYFVLTPSLTSLLEVGVIKDKQPFPECLARSNIDEPQLQNVARRVSEFCGVPAGREFCPFGNKPDVAIFDFSQRTVASDALLFLHASGSTTHANPVDPTSAEKTLLSLKADGVTEDVPLLVQLAGDALMEPFWPQGTGANRAVLSALDCVWELKRWWMNECSIQELLSERAGTFANMRISDPNSLIAPRTRRASTVTREPNFELDPKARYKPDVL